LQDSDICLLKSAIQQIHMPKHYAMVLVSYKITYFGGNGRKNLFLYNRIWFSYFFEIYYGTRIEKMDLQELGQDY